MEPLLLYKAEQESCSRWVVYIMLVSSAVARICVKHNLL